MCATRVILHRWPSSCRWVIASTWRRHFATHRSRPQPYPRRGSRSKIIIFFTEYSRQSFNNVINAAEKACCWRGRRVLWEALINILLVTLFLLRNSCFLFFSCYSLDNCLMINVILYRFNNLRSLVYYFIISKINITIHQYHNKYWNILVDIKLP